MLLTLVFTSPCSGQTPVEGKFIVKLADFGLSRRVQVKQQAINLRKSVSGMRLQASLPVPAKGVMTPGATPTSSMQRMQSMQRGAR